MRVSAWTLIEMTFRKVKMMPLLALLVVGLSIALATVLVTRPIAMTGTIIATQNIQAYTDAGCTTVFTAWVLGDTVKRGDVLVKDVWLKNVGDADIKFSWNMAAALPTGVTMTATSPTGAWASTVTTSAKTPGEVIKATFTLTIGSTAPLGAMSYTLNLNGEE